MQHTGQDIRNGDYREAALIEKIRALSPGRVHEVDET